MFDGIFWFMYSFVMFYYLIVDKQFEIIHNKQEIHKKLLDRQFNDYDKSRVLGHPDTSKQE